MDPKTRREEANRKLRERRLQDKERGLCTKCHREPAKPNKARCKQCNNKTQERRASKKQGPNRPRSAGSEPITPPKSEETAEQLCFPFTIC